MPSKVQLTGGAFQDSEGNLLANGYLTMKLNQDENVSGVGNVCSGVTIKIILDTNGNVQASPTQSVWGNDQMSPANSYYRVTGYTTSGQIAWGPNNQQVTGNGGTFDTGTWVPNKVFSWTPAVQPITFQTNEVNNGNQTLYDLHAGNNITLTDNGSGRVTIDSSSSPVATTGNYFLSTQNVGGFSYAADSRMTDGVSGSNGIAAVQVFLPYPITFTKISINVQTNQGSTFGLVAVYNSTGGSKIFDCGTNAFDTGTTGVKTVTVGSTTLSAGIYLLAWTNTGTAGTVRVTGVDVAATSLDQDLLTLLNTNIKRYARSNQSASAGAMPSTLGTLTAPVSGQRFDVPVVIFE